MPKKGYRIKLPTAAGILDMPAERDWVLLANYADKTLMRNYLGMELSRRLGMAWTPRLRYVEVFLNGDFIGNYLLGDHVERGPNRINVTPLTATDNADPNITGGYVIEADFLQYTAPDDLIFYTRYVLFNVKEPDAGDITPQQFDYLRWYTQIVEDAIVTRNFDPITGYPDLIDVDSFINWYLVKELFRDVDGPFRSSVYLYKERNSKMKMGPLWDFDLAAGNVNFSDAADPVGWRIRTKSEWFANLFEDPVFRKKVRDRWRAVKKPHIDTLLRFIDQTATSLNASQQLNFTRWDILDTYVWPNPVVTGSYQGEVKYLKDWLSTRIKWMDKNL